MGHACRVSVSHGLRVSWVKGHMGHELLVIGRGYVGQVSHGSRVSRVMSVMWVTWVMTHVCHGSRGAGVAWVMGHL